MSSASGNSYMPVSAPVYGTASYLQSAAKTQQSAQNQDLFHTTAADPTCEKFFTDNFCKNPMQLRPKQKDNQTASPLGSKSENAAFENFHNFQVFLTEKLTSLQQAEDKRPLLERLVADLDEGNRLRPLRSAIEQALQTDDLQNMEALLEKIGPNAISRTECVIVLMTALCGITEMIFFAFAMTGTIGLSVTLCSWVCGISCALTIVFMVAYLVATKLSSYDNYLPQDISYSLKRDLVDFVRAFQTDKNIDQACLTVWRALDLTLKKGSVDEKAWNDFKKLLTHKKSIRILTAIARDFIKNRAAQGLIAHTNI